MYRLPADAYKKICAKIDSYVNNIFWIKLEQRHKNQIKGEIMDDQVRENFFLKREVVGVVGSDMLKYHKTIGIDNLFPL